ncbi:PP-loop domain protein [Methanococcus vannielii SB]|jgi:tRNA(Ile)-lysidine synthase TilS/MesJ|uniref:PP-loop domain protein n=1 Tax=Methanococcus vannielii (strain ATCC 35089 / DSM 1224 / JCM 13029 / OCM 148 / SB) TaxID=406327 RepID=A6UNL4_METVS|nr:tRNA 2-thiocytidine biosynthesis TtcA family protein [Methanococcus vannielii]ABR54086.1 PP-loop domain protein [Methanococcus vannielii SB]
MIDLRELKKYCNPSYLIIRNDKIIVSNKGLARLSKDKMKEIEAEFGIPVIYSRVFEEISERMGRFVSKNNIISPKDKVVVGLSGGKDSLALLHLLEPYKRKYGVEIHAITVDLNIDGIRPWNETNKNVKMISKTCENLNIPHKIIPYDENVVEMSKILSKNSKGIDYSPCFSCSISRRHILTNYAKETFNCENVKIALGHTLEDNSDTIIANILKGNIIKALEPIKNFDETKIDFDGLKVSLKNCCMIRPLLNISEEKIKKALNECNIEYYKDKDECPYSRVNGDGIRKKSHEVLKNLEKDVPNIREMVISSIVNSIEHYKRN